jgi:hypothetical protein
MPLIFLPTAKLADKICTSLYVRDFPLVMVARDKKHQGHFSFYHPQPIPLFMRRAFPLFQKMTTAATSTVAHAGKTIKIDIVSDTVCPWCYIGKRRLEVSNDYNP